MVAEERSDRLDSSLPPAPVWDADRWGLRFTDSAIEADYRAWYLDVTRFFSRLGLYASLGAWTVALVGFGLVVPEGFRHGGPYAAAALLVVGAMLVVTYIEPLRPWVPVATLFANGFAGLAVIGFSRALLSTEDLPLAGMGIITLVYFGFVVFRLHPLPAGLTVATYLLGYEVLLTIGARAGEIDATPYWVATILVITSYGVGFFICALIERQMRLQFRDERTIEHQKDVIDEQRRQADDLLLNILPEQIAERLKRAPGVIAERFDDVTVLFADVVSFTPLAASVDPDEVVEMLNDVFSHFDELVRERGVEKIKTIGDAYMVVGGLPQPRADHAAVVAELALDMRDTLRTRLPDGSPMELRIGIATGPVVAGVIGTHKFAYDLWGDTVNTAARMESHGVPGRIQISEATHDRLRGSYEMTGRGTVDIKGKGAVRTWFLTGRVGRPAAE